MRSWPTRKKKRKIIKTHLSNNPSVSPTIPGPANTTQCSIESKPESQGMRESSSTIRDAQLHNFMLAMGRLDAIERVAGGCPACGNCDWRFASTGD